MEGDVTYADLRFPLSEGGRRPTQAEPTADTKKEQCPENSAGPRSSLWVRSTILLGILCLLLLSACIALGILVLGSANEKPLEAEARESTEMQTQDMEKFQEIQDTLNRTQELLNQTTADLKNATEELQRWRSQAVRRWYCPIGWIVRDRNCFYISTTSANWVNSLRDCIANEATLVSIKNLELTLIRERFNYYWVGALCRDSGCIQYNATESIYYSEDYIIYARGSSCGAIYIGQTAPVKQPCNHLFRWICERPAILLDYYKDTTQPELSINGKLYYSVPGKENL